MKSLLLIAIIIVSAITNVSAGIIPRYTIPHDNDVIQTFDRSIETKIPSTFNVLVWNMYKGLKKNWEKDFTKLSQNHDLLITQEMAMTGRMQEIFETELAFEFSSATSFFNDGKGRTGVATISKAPSILQIYQRSKYREPLIKTPKVVLITTYPLSNGETLMIANIHAVNFVSVIELLDQIRTVVKVLNNHNGPAIFGGDFNTWSKRKTRDMRKILSSANMTEVKYSQDFRTSVFGNKIDYLWYKNLNLDSSKVLADIQGSDHLPMSHEFSVLLD